MVIKGKIFIMLLIPILSLLGMMFYGVKTLKGLSDTTSSLVNDRFNPLIEGYFAGINTMRARIKLML